MDVVRFKEADVIVASGTEHMFATIYGWGDGISNNATITFKDGSTDSYDYALLHSQVHNGVLNGGLTFFKDKDSVNLGQLASTEDDYSGFNGNYEKNESNGHYYWKQ